MKRVRLTTLEIETILAVAGDALAEETLSNPDPALFQRELAAFESGMEKLRTLLARKESQ
jgi:hypothetical protein